jgi:predicted metalloendopeptidase
MGLDKSYYTDKSTEKVLFAYVVFLQQLLSLWTGANFVESLGMAYKVLMFENELAKVALTPVEERNITLVTNMFRYIDLPENFPGIPWNVIAEKTKVSPEDIGSVVMDCTRYVYFSSRQMLHST